MITPLGSLVALLTLSPSTLAGVRPLPPTTMAKGQRALDIGQGYSLSQVALELETPEGKRTYTPRSGLTPTFFTVRLGLKPCELTLGPTGLGARVPLVDPSKSATALRAAFGAHARLLQFYTSTGDSQFYGSAGASVTVGGEWGDPSKTLVRPYLAAQYEHVDLQQFAVPNLNSQGTAHGFYATQADVSAGLTQSVVHISGGIDFPTETIQGPRITPGLFVDIPVGTGPGNLTLSACKTCAVGVGSVSTAKSPGFYAILRLEPRLTDATKRGTSE